MSDWPTPEEYWQSIKWPFIHGICMVVILGILTYMHWVPKSDLLQFLLILVINIIVGSYTVYRHFKKS